MPKASKTGITASTTARRLVISIITAAEMQINPVTTSLLRSASTKTNFSASNASTNPKSMNA